MRLKRRKRRFALHQATSFSNEKCSSAVGTGPRKLVASKSVQPIQHTHSCIILRHLHWLFPTPTLWKHILLLYIWPYYRGRRRDSHILLDTDSKTTFLHSPLLYTHIVLHTQLHKLPHLYLISICIPWRIADFIYISEYKNKQTNKKNPYYEQNLNRFVISFDACSLWESSVLCWAENVDLMWIYKMSSFKELRNNWGKDKGKKYYC